MEYPCVLYKLCYLSASASCFSHQNLEKATSYWKKLHHVSSGPHALVMIRQSISIQYSDLEKKKVAERHSASLHLWWQSCWKKIVRWAKVLRAPKTCLVSDLDSRTPKRKFSGVRVLLYRINRVLLCWRSSFCRFSSFVGLRPITQSREEP